MHISKLVIKGFRSFGFEESPIYLKENLSAFIGLNSSGKSTALEALRKIFGSTSSEREIYRQDFHIGKDEDIDEIDARNLTIEIRLEFSDAEEEAVPHFFSYMVVDEEGGIPYLRLRLESTWTRSPILPDGEILTRIVFVNVPENQTVTEDSKQIYPSHYRSLIQILYVPAIRKPSEQLRYNSGTILYRVLKKIKWDDEFKDTLKENIDTINSSFKDQEDFKSVQSTISTFWKKFHKDSRYQDTKLGFRGNDIDAILKKIEVSFSPSGIHKEFTIDELGEGYRSLFYLTLVCSLLDLEENLKDDDDEIGVTKPLLTILAIEEPENHIAPQLLGRVIKILSSIGENNNSQVLLSSHTPAIVKRISPSSIIHFRITGDYTTQVNKILLPKKTDEAFKYIKEAIHNYPEIYFARLVVIGEGDSEEVIFNRMMEVMDVNFDDNVITFAPLGHRFVNHIWKLLKVLNIPYVTLLDLDTERDGGGWGRIKYVLTQLLESGSDKNEVLALEGGTLLSKERLEKMHTWDLKKLENLNSWVKRLETFNVYFSAPLDLDFLMLNYYTDLYKKAIPDGGGPRLPDKVKELDKYKAKILTGIHATLKSESAIALTYTEESKELMIWYNYHFLGRGKPATHMQVLSEMTNEEIFKNIPPVFLSMFKAIEILLTLKEEDEDEEDWDL